MKVVVVVPTYNEAQNLPVPELVRTIQKLMGGEKLDRMITDSTKGEMRAQHPSAASARSRLHWEPRCDMKRGLSETMEWRRVYLGG